MAHHELVAMIFGVNLQFCELAVPCVDEKCEVVLREVRGQTQKDIHPVKHVVFITYSC